MYQPNDFFFFTLSVSKSVFVCIVQYIWLQEKKKEREMFSCEYVLCVIYFLFIKPYISESEGKKKRSFEK